MAVLCPKCKSKEITFIIVGDPSSEGFKWMLDKPGRVTTTGGTISGFEMNSRCRSCGYEFDHDWTDEEIEEL